MTQVVAPATVVAPLDDQTLRARGRTVRFSREEDTFFAEMIDPEWDAAQRAEGHDATNQDRPPRVRRPVVMSTGSHHFQTYWINGRHGNHLWQVPWVFHLATKRWMPAEDAFLAPPTAPHRLTLWNKNCIQCHVVAGHPGLDPQTGTFASSVADYGISCEACHGPGEKHVAKYRGQAENHATADDEDTAVINPAKLEHARSAQVCGQCHSYFSFSDPEFWSTGFKYRPGDDLHATRMIHDFDDEYVQSRPDLLQGYWGDGTMRIAGREFSAMDDSLCFQRGELSCVSCHSMHDFEAPDDQLAPGHRQPAACTQCHAGHGERIAEHTHHAPGSAGSNCYNCHMPYTSFGLLKAIRSHRIDSPSAAMTAQHGRPNACNLCHADRTLEWTADRLHEWYGQEQPELSELEKSVSSSLLLLLKGDAVQRAVVAWSFGTKETREAAGDAWQPAYLALLMADPYAAVRFTVDQSLRRYRGFGEFEFDFLGSADERAAAMGRAVQLWRQQVQAPAEWAKPSILLDAEGNMDIQQAQSLMGRRDDRPISLPE
jgi:hypothetical protein